MQSAVETESAEWIVHMRGVADEDEPALAEIRGDTLMHAVNAGVLDVVRCRARQEMLQGTLGESMAQHHFIGQ